MTIAIASLGGGGGGDDSTSKESPDDDSIDIQVTLSRSSFVAGGTVVGTVRLVAHRHDARTTTSNNNLPPRRRIHHHHLHPRDGVSSIALTAVGYCRLDPRWHKETEYHKAYGCSSSGSSSSNITDSISTSQQSPDLLLSRLSKDTPNRRNIFWASASSTTEKGGAASLELLNLPEQTDTSWESVVRPRPIRLGPLTKARGSRNTAEEVEDNVSDEDSEEGDFDEVDLEDDEESSLPLNHDVMSHDDNLENRQWTSTFRIDLPENLPPTLAATSCRYTYAILVRCVVKNRRRRPSSTGAASSSSSLLNTTVEWVQVPFVVLTTPTCSLTPQVDLLSATTATNCHAFAHSAGLPFGLTSTEVFYPRSSAGNLTVHRGGSSFFGNLSHQQRLRQQHGHHHPVHASLQTLRISNPAGRPVAVLTILGGTTTASSALYLSPGSRLILKLDFPKKDWTPSSSSRPRRVDGEYHHHDDNGDGNVDDGNWVPCYQVSACLQGEEIVVQPDGSRSTRARQHILSTAHQVMDPACTESLSLDLMVPDNSHNSRTTTPFSVSTNVVEITTRCLVDLTVGVVGSSNGSSSDVITGYSNLRLEIPIQIGHGTSLSMLQEDDQDVEDEHLISTLLDLSSPSKRTTNHHKNNDDDDSFQTMDIRHDLKQLALSMADQCGLST